MGEPTTFLILPHINNSQKSRKSLDPNLRKEQKNRGILGQSSKILGELIFLPLW